MIRQKFKKQYLKFSLIICGYNEEKNLDVCISSCLNQNYSKNNYEIIYVDNNSKDNSLKIAKKYPIKIFTELKMGSSNARNKGISKSVGEIIIFLDADTKLTKNYLLETEKGFSDINIGASGGMVLPIKKTWISNYLGISLFETYPRFKKFKFVRNHPSCNLAIRKKIIDEVGLFNEDLGSQENNIHLMEDKDLCERITKKEYKILYNPKAVIYHKNRYTLKDWYTVLHKSAKTRLSLIKQSKEDFFSTLFRYHFPSIYLLILLVSFFISFQFSIILIFIALIFQLSISIKFAIETKLILQSFLIKPFLDILSLYLIEFIIIKYQIFGK